MGEVERGDSRLVGRYRVSERTLLRVAWSPDGGLLAVGGQDHTVRLVTPTGVERACLGKHLHFVGSIVFSADGRRVVSGASITVRIWDVATGVETLMLRGHWNNVLAVAVSPDGSRIASSGNDGTIRLSDANSGALLAVLDGHDGEQCVRIAASPDFAQLVSCSWKSAVRLWDISTRREIMTLNGHRGKVNGVAFSPTGKQVASYGDDKAIRLWDVASGSEQACLLGHTGRVNFIAFTPDGQYLASASGDRTVRLWHIAQRREIACLGDYHGEVWCVAFSPDGRRLASVGADGNLCIWDTADLAPAASAPSSQTSPTTAWLARQVATLGLVANLPQQAPEYWVPHLPGEDGAGLLGVLQAEEPDLWDGCVAVSKDGRRLYKHAAEGWVQAWDLATGGLIWQNRHQANVIQELTLSPDGACIASATFRTIHLYNCETGEVVACLYGHTDWVYSIAFSPNGRLLASGSRDNTIRIWDVVTASEVMQLAAPNSWNHCVRFSQDGRLLASSSRNKIISLWQVETGVQVPWLEPQHSEVTCIAFSPDGQSLVAGFAHGTIRMWQLSGAVKPEQFDGHDDDVICMSFSPDGRRLATSAAVDDADIRIWDTMTCIEIQRLTFATDKMLCSSIAWSPDGAFLAAGLGKGTANLYDTRTPAMLASAARPAPVQATPATAPDLPLPAHLTALPPTWATLHRLTVPAPLSLLHDLQAILSGQTPPALQALAPHPGLHALRALRWPAPAGIGIIALLLHQWPGGTAWQPPTGTAAHELFTLLADALQSSIPAATQDESARPTAPIAWLTESLARVDERLLTLLTALGPQAVAADPGLPLRLLPQLPHLPPMTERHRQLLGSQLPALDTGPAQGSGSGIDRAGLALRGPITALVPSQWAYPRHLLHWRHAEGGLLYRTRTGREPPRLRPMVIVLDTSPACWGVIESLTRPAAHALADILARSRCPALLLTAADRQVHFLGNPAERLSVLTHRSTQTPDIAAVLARAQALAQELSTTPDITPLILLLTHCRWGAEWEGPAKPLPGLRALFVQYPGPATAPPFAPRCQRWQTLQHKQVSAVPAALAHLIAH